MLLIREGSRDVNAESAGEDLLDEEVIPKEFWARECGDVAHECLDFVRTVEPSVLSEKGDVIGFPCLVEGLLEFEEEVGALRQFDVVFQQLFAELLSLVVLHR